MLREAQTGTEGHVIGVDETCGVCSSGLGVYCDRSRFRFKVPKAKGRAYLLDGLVNYVIGSARLCPTSQLVLECEKLLVKAILS